MPGLTELPAVTTIRVLALIEASTVSGPAKNLFQFSHMSRQLGLTPAIEILLATFQRSSRETGASEDNSEFVEAARNRNIPLYCIPERFPFDPRVIAGLRSLVAQVAPDLIETHAIKSHFLVRISGVWRTLPWIAFHHGYTQGGLRSHLYKTLDCWSLKIPNRIVTMNRAFEHQLCRRGVPASRISVLHNAVSPVRKNSGVISAQRTRQRLGISERERVVVSIGRLSREKAQTDLIAALAELRNIQPALEVRLLIAGGGPERGTIEQAARAAGLMERVILTGHLRDVSSCFDIADVLAISSLSEGSPNVLLEAMAAGVPVVATAVGGIPEIVANRETALLVPARDPVAMALAIEQLLCDRGLAENIANRARELARTRYSPLSRTKSLVNLYGELCFSSRSCVGSAPIAYTHGNRATGTGRHGCSHELSSRWE